MFTTIPRAATAGHVAKPGMRATPTMPGSASTRRARRCSPIRSVSHYKVVPDTLAPAERLASVLHDMFELPFDDMAPLVGRTPAAARDLLPTRRPRPTCVDQRVCWRRRHRDRQPGTVMGSAVTSGKIIEIQFLVDPERLAQLDLSMLESPS